MQQTLRPLTKVRVIVGAKRARDKLELGADDDASHMTRYRNHCSHHLPTNRVRNMCELDDCTSARDCSDTRAQSANLNLLHSSTPITVIRKAGIALERALDAPSQDALRSSLSRPAKTSRYLREVDRHTILARIARGEKQSALAKEFHVSRAAICNLNKHREQVLARTPNLLAKHPKKPRAYKTSVRNQHKDDSDSSGSDAHCAMAARLKQPDVAARVCSITPPTLLVQTRLADATKNAHPNGCFYERSVGDSSSLQVADDEVSAHLSAFTSGVRSPVRNSPSATVVTEVQTRPIAALLTLVRSRNATPKQRRRYADRLLHLVVERALEVALATASVGNAHAPHTLSFGVALRASDMAMAHAFQHLAPRQPVGYLLRARIGGASLTLASQLRGRDSDLADRIVFLFGLAVYANAGRHVVDAVRVLIQHHNAREERVWIVTLAVATSVVEGLHARFPRVRIITATIQASAPPRNGLSERVETVETVDSEETPWRRTVVLPPAPALSDALDQVWPLQQRTEDDERCETESSWIIAPDDALGRLRSLKTASTDYAEL